MIENPKDIVWCVELYRACYVLGEKIIMDFKNLFPVEMNELDIDYEDAYEEVLLAAVCAAGGNEGHLKFLHANYFVYDYIYKDGEVKEVIDDICNAVEQDYVLGNEDNSITIDSAVMSMKKEIKKLKKYISEALTVISGSKVPITVERFEPLLDFITSKN